MNPKSEKLIGVAALIITVLSGTLLFIIKPENLPNPEMAEYYLKLALYPSGLVLLRAIWKTLLDNKIRSQAQREADLKRAIEENEPKK